MEPNFSQVTAITIRSALNSQSSIRWENVFKGFIAQLIQQLEMIFKKPVHSIPLEKKPLDSYNHNHHLGDGNIGNKETQMSVHSLGESWLLSHLCQPCLQSRMLSCDVRETGYELFCHSLHPYKPSCIFSMYTLGNHVFLSIRS
jgi:hypothetical protein